MSEQNRTRPDREAVRQRAVEIVQQEARDLGYIEEDVAELADPDGDGLLALQAVERAILALLPAEPVQEMREGEREAMQEAFHAIDAALGTSDDVIEWIEPIRASKRGQADDDETRRERKTALYGMLDGAREKLRAALAAPQEQERQA